MNILGIIKEYGASNVVISLNYKGLTYFGIWPKHSYSYETMDEIVNFKVNADKFSFSKTYVNVIPFDEKDFTDEIFFIDHIEAARSLGCCRVFVVSNVGDQEFYSEVKYVD